MSGQANTWDVAPSQVARTAIAIDELAICHLRTHSEIERILHLRKAIDLTVHAAAGAQFAEREKKVMSAGLSVLSSCAGKPSARSGSCPWTAA